MCVYMHLLKEENTHTKYNYSEKQCMFLLHNCGLLLFGLPGTELAATHKRASDAGVILKMTNLYLA